MPRPEAVTAAVFIDPVTEFNGPILLVPGSQNVMIDSTARETAPTWRATVIADLKYTVGQDDLLSVVKQSEIVAPKGDRGSVLFFHCNIVHGSVPNMSPMDRRVAFVSYNSVKNALVPVSEPRPWFMARRQFDPILAGADDALQTTVSSKLV